MRSQDEILTQIRKIGLSGVDPTRLQRRTLIHKLTWVNAQPFLDETSRNSSDLSDTWHLRSGLDKEKILEEIVDQADYTYMLMADHDFAGVFASLQIMMCQIWLLGPRGEKFLNIFMPEMMNSKKDCGRSCMKKLCEEFGFNWKLFERRYLDNLSEGGVALP